MADENDLKRMFDSVRLSEGNGIDAKQVIRRSRARRLPKQLAAGATGALVLVGVTVLGVQSMQVATPNSADTLMLQEDDAGSAEDGDDMFATKIAPADRLNLCGAPVAESVPSAVGLVLDVVFPATAPAASDRIDGLVIMTNTTTATVTGSTLVDPAITLSQDGITVWHTNGPTDLVATRVDLAPGASMQFAASFEPVRCEPEDDALEAFRPDLPPAGAGNYEVSAAVDFSSDQMTETTEAFLVTGPPMPITLE